MDSSLSERQSLGGALAANSGHAAAADAEAAGAAKWAVGVLGAAAAAFGVFLRLDVTSFNVLLRFAHIITSFFLFIA